MEKMFVIDQEYGDYTKAGPFDSVRLWSVEDENVVLLCDNKQVRVGYGFGIFLEEVEE